jgi:hypothetical protein
MLLIMKFDVNVPHGYWCVVVAVSQEVFFLKLRAAWRSGAKPDWDSRADFYPATLST